MQTYKNNIFLTFALLFFCTGIVYGQQRGEKLSGTPIGSVSVDYSTGKTSTTVNTPACAFDGNTKTFYASYNRSNTWVGLDLGSPHVITRVGWCPRESQPTRVQLGVFEASNREDFLDAVPLYLIPEGGTANKIDYADVNVSRGFRYVRYVGPNDVRCNIGELEFYGYEGEGDDSKFYQITNLPTVSIHTEVGYDPQDKVTELPSFVTITYDNGTRIQEYPITAKGRGNASWGYPKKPWRIKFNDGKSHHMLKGSPLESPAKAKKWTLINNYGDKTLMRNILAFETSRRIGMPYTVYCQPVDVIMNGEYKGCYQLCDQISIDSHRVPIVEMTPDDNEDPFITGGYLVEIDAYASQESSWFTSSRGIPVTIKSPDADDITTQQSKYIKDYFNLLEKDLWKSNFTDSVEGFRRRMDVESFLQHFIVGEFSGNMDTYWSTYMYKNREEDRFTVAPCWDFDLAYDNDQRIDVLSRSDWAYLGGSAASGMRSFVSRVLSDNAVQQRIAEIWSDMRDRGLFSATSLIAYIDSTAQVLDESQRLNFIRWPILNKKVHQNKVALGNYDAEVDVVRKYVRDRIAWIDNYLNYKAGPVYKDSTYYISNAQEMMAFAEAVNNGANGSNAYLTADIDMAAYSSDFVPIGTDSKPYHGTFDGRSHRILNLNVRGENGVGVFGTVTGGATIKNFILDSSSSISGTAFVGIVGVSSGSGLVTISCVGNEADITGTAQNVAGIIGCNMGSTCDFFLSDCYNTGTITGDRESAAICGWMGDNAVMQNCWNIGTVSGYDWGLDMVRGGNTMIENCYSTFGSQVTSISMQPVTSGELCYNLNKGETEGINWYQTLGSDAHPVLDCSHYTVHKAADGTYYSINNLRGDVNGDGKVTEDDIQAIVAYILNPTDPNFPVYRADINNDNAVDVYDIVALRNYIDGALQKNDLFTARLYAANTNVKAGGTRKVNVTLSSDMTPSAWQADIKFGPMLSAKPESAQLGTIVSESHIIKASQTEEGIRVLAYSPTQEPLLNRTGVAFYFIMDGDSAFSDASNFTFSNIRVVAADGSHADVNDASYDVAFSKTYVSSIVFPESDVDIILGSQITLTPTVLSSLATNKVLTWSTSDASIASVDQQGNVVAGNMGDAVVTATATDGSRISGRVNIHVVEDPEVGINSLTPALSQGEGEVYDLSGRKIDSSLFTLHSSLKKGVYIINGKKVLVK